MEPQQPTGAPAPAPAPMGEVAPSTAQPVTAASVDPGKGLGVASLISAFFIPLLGLILGIVAKSKSKKAGFKNGLATGGIVISVIGMVVSLIIGIAVMAGILSVAAKCKDLGPGTHYENGTTITCS